MSKLTIKNNIQSELTIAHRDDKPAKTIYTDELTKAVATVANMETITTPSDGDVCIVKDMDRGGTFIYNSTLVASDNQGTNFSGWIRQYSGAVNVKWFGAKGDSSTNDYYTLKQALVFGVGQEVVIPKSDGEYHFTPDTGENLQVLDGTILTFEGSYLKYVGGVTTGGAITIGDNVKLYNPLIDLELTTITGSSGNNAIGVKSNTKNVMIIGGDIRNCPRGNGGIMDGGKGIQMEGGNTALTIDGTNFYKCHMAISIRRDLNTEPTLGGTKCNITNVTTDKCNISLYSNISNATYTDGREFSVNLSNFIFKDCGELGDGQPNDLDGVFQFNRASNMTIANGVVSGSTKIDAIFRGRGRNLSIANVQINQACISVVSIDPSFYADDQSLMYGNTYDLNINSVFDYLFLSDLTDSTYSYRFLDNSFFNVNLTNDATIMLATPATRNGSTKLTVKYLGVSHSAVASQMNSKKLLDIVMDTKIISGTSILGNLTAMPTLEVSGGSGVKLSGNAGVNIDSVFETLNSSQTGAPIVRPTADNSMILGSSTKRWKEVSAYNINSYGEFWTSGNLTVHGTVITMDNLPTSDPLSSGKLWNNAGVVTVSAG